MKRIRVLWFVDVLETGGIQMLLSDYVDHMDRERLQIDILTLDDGKHYSLEDSLRVRGVKVYRLPGIWLHSALDFVRQAQALDRFFSTHAPYDIVHVHASSKNFLVLQRAKRHGVPVRIAHSHNTMFQSESRMHRLIGDLLKKPFARAATDWFACSVQAGDWLFGEENRSRVEVFPNAVNVERFRYAPETRRQLRAQLGYGEETLVLGHIGRMAPQKNHAFLLRIFAALQQEQPDSALLLVGDGELRDAIETQAQALGIVGKVHFAGCREDRERYLQAMDAFVSPSKFEGFGITLVEAQLAGLPCVVSTGTAPESVRITDQLCFYPLSQPPEEWAKLILQRVRPSQRDAPCAFRQSEMEIGPAVQRLQRRYLALAQKMRLQETHLQDMLTKQL